MTSIQTSKSFEQFFTKDGADDIVAGAITAKSN